jgi:hypothetical protein
MDPAHLSTGNPGAPPGAWLFVKVSKNQPEKTRPARFSFALCRGLIYHAAKSKRGLFNDEE